jgi:hypothetical protein
VNELQAGGACYSWRFPPPRWLGGVISVEAHKKIVRCSREVIVREYCAHLTGSRRTTLIERDTEGDKCSNQVKVLELVVSTPRGGE